MCLQTSSNCPDSLPRLWRYINLLLTYLIIIIIIIRHSYFHRAEVSSILRDLHSRMINWHFTYLFTYWHSTLLLASAIRLFFMRRYMSYLLVSEFECHTHVHVIFKVFYKYYWCKTLMTNHLLFLLLYLTQQYTLLSVAVHSVVPKSGTLLVFSYHIRCIIVPILI